MRIATVASRERRDSRPGGFSKASPCWVLGGRGLAFEFDDSKPCYLSIIEEYAFENIRSNYSHVVFSAYQMGAKFTQGKKGAACPLPAHATTRKVLLYLGCWSLDQFISPLHLLHRDFFLYRRLCVGGTFPYYLMLCRVWRIVKEAWSIPEERKLPPTLPSSSLLRVCSLEMSSDKILIMPKLRSYDAKVNSNPPSPQ